VIVQFTRQRLFKVLKWVAGGDSAAWDKSIEPNPHNNLEETLDLNLADIVTSEVIPMFSFPSDDPKHMVMFDVDVPMVVIPSSTPGHNHVYFPNTYVSKNDLFNLLDALAGAGIVERGYAEASKARGFTALRLPWVTKSERSRRV
jgi:hypothetical protein